VDTLNISDIIVILIPFTIFGALWLINWLEQRLPEKQRAALKEFASIAIKKVEQQFSDLSNSQKKQAAIDIVEQMFHEFKMPVPHLAIIDAVIEACIWEMNHVRTYSGAIARRSESPQIPWRNRPSKYFSPDSTNDLRG
jgi:hypothetical protein